jgi:hypothetical protein
MMSSDLLPWTWEECGSVGHRKSYLIRDPLNSTSAAIGVVFGNDIDAQAISLAPILCDLVKERSRESIKAARDLLAGWTFNPNQADHPWTWLPEAGRVVTESGQVVAYMWPAKKEGDVHDRYGRLASSAPMLLAAWAEILKNDQEPYGLRLAERAYRQAMNIDLQGRPRV